MKSRFTSLFALAVILAFASATSLSAQSFEVTHFETSPVMGTPSQSLEHHGTLKNISSTEKTITVRYYMGGVASGHYASMCTDEACYSLPEEIFGSYDLPDVTLAPGGSVALKALLSPIGAEGISTMPFLIFDKNNPADTITYRVQFNVNIANSVDDLSELQGTTVSPNPAGDVVNITGVAVASITSVELYNMQGVRVQSVSHNGASSVALDVQALAAGTYSALVHTTSGKVFSTQISVVR